MPSSLKRKASQSMDLRELSNDLKVFPKKIVKKVKKKFILVKTVTALLFANSDTANCYTDVNKT